MCPPEACPVCSFWKSKVIFTLALLLGGSGPGEALDAFLISGGASRMDPVTLWPSQTQYHKPCDLGYLGNLSYQPPPPPRQHTHTHSHPALGLSMPRRDFQAWSHHSAPCSQAGSWARGSQGSSYCLSSPSNIPLAVVHAYEEHQAQLTLLFPLYMCLPSSLACEILDGRNSILLTGSPECATK